MELTKDFVLNEFERYKGDWLEDYKAIQFSNSKNC